MLLSRVCHRTERIRIAESLYYSDYASHHLMFDVMGFGASPDDTSPLMTNLEIVRSLYVGAAHILADGLGLGLGDVRPFRTTVTTERDLTVASGHLAAGTIAAIRMGVDAYYNGRRAITVEHCTRMDPDLAPDWPNVQGYTIELIGEPTLTAHITVGKPDEEHSVIGCHATAAHALNAVATVVAARIGVRTLADIDNYHGGRALVDF
ncbi:hypothetical protein [Mycobacterium sp.]|uniref:hypothetical protein n=1 Tax=Mycobacterium sp. TaxID=1785 RepID=UPI003F95650B